MVDELETIDKVCRLFLKTIAKSFINDFYLTICLQSIKALEATKQINLERQRRVIGRLIFYSTLLYLFMASIYYVYYFPDTWAKIVMQFLPLLTFSIL